MADQSLQQVLLEAFFQARGNASAGSGALPEGLEPRPVAALGDAIAELTRQTTGVVSVSQVLTETVAVNTQAVAQNTAVQGVKSLVGEIGKTATNVLGGTFGLSPILTGLVRLFGGGQAEPPPPLVRYAPPPAVRFEGTSNGPIGGPYGAPGVDYGQDGRPRPVGLFEDRTPTVPAAPAPQITVQVQAMDSRSFLDHSSEIARAVRDAMLNMHSLNDVVSEL